MSTARRRHRAALGLVAFVVTLAALTITSAGGPGSSSGRVAAADIQVSSALAGATSRYVPINPIRVLDTRSDATLHRLPANGSLSIAPVTVEVSNASGVAIVNAQAVVLNVTMVDAGGSGFATIWPTGSPQPEASSLNADFALQNVPNMVTVPLGADGSISLFSSNAADYAIDVQGVYEGATSATAGRLVPLTPRRAIDTRPGGTLGPNGAITVDLTSVGVPVGASAAVLNVTATQTLAAGYFTVWPADTPIPVASNLNVPGPAYTVANQVIARVTNGRINVYSFAGGDIIVDVNGYVTGDAAIAGADGLFVPLTPNRLLDTRTAGGFSTGLPIVSGGSITLPIADRGGVPPAGVQSVALNVTATRTQAAGFLTTWPANTPRPNTSSLNFTAAGRTVPNHVITQLNIGAASFYSFGGNDLLVDVMGYWTDGGPYSFLYQSSPKSNALPYGRWNPCAPIVYLVNSDRATDPTWIDQMNLAITTIEAASGLDFVYGGQTSAGLDFNIPTGADAVIGFSDQAATAQLAGGVIGIGGGSYSASTGRAGRGFAFADVADIQSPGRLLATFTHEISHLVGLDHVADPDQLMYAYATLRSELNSGDRAGLFRLGTSQPCLAFARLSDAEGQGAVGSDTLPDDAVVVFAD